MMIGRVGGFLVVLALERLCATKSGAFNGDCSSNDRVTALVQIASLRLSFLSG